MFNDVLKRLRKSNNYTQSELAHMLKISKSTVCMYELGERSPDHEMMKRISELFNVSMDFLYGREKKKAARIPVLGYVAAGIPLETIEDIIDYEEIPEQMTRDGSQFFALQIKGQSMEPKPRLR